MRVNIPLSLRLIEIQISEENHVCFELTSKIIDFHLIDGCTAPDSLIILAEEEIVFIDLVSRGWPEWSAPYLMSLHASAITCLSQHSGLEQGVMETLCQVILASHWLTMTNAVS